MLDHRTKIYFSSRRKMEVSFLIASFELRTLNNVNPIVPVVVVLTQYDRLERSNIARLRGAKLPPAQAEQQAAEATSTALAACVSSIEASIARLNLTIPTSLTVTSGMYFPCSRIYTLSNRFRSCWLPGWQCLTIG